jgi:solute carrier family 45, member 1/2/4
MLDSLKNLCSGNSYGAIEQEEIGIENHGYSTVPGENIIKETSFTDESHLNLNPNPTIIVEEQAPNLSHYLKSIFFMPFSIRMVCVTNLFCWMAHVCYSLYFTDFVGEAVFDGDPKVIGKILLKTLFFFMIIK